MFRRFKAAYIIIIMAMILGMLGIQPAEPVEAAGAAGLFFPNTLKVRATTKRWRFITAPALLLTFKLTRSYCLPMAAQLLVLR
jgi:hypothetical protein